MGKILVVNRTIGQSGQRKLSTAGEKKIGVLTPFHPVIHTYLNSFSIRISLFCTRILSRYGHMDDFPFHQAILTFLRQIKGNGGIKTVNQQISHTIHHLIQNKNHTIARNYKIAREQNFYQRRRNHSLTNRLSYEHLMNRTNSYQLRTTGGISTSLYRIVNQIIRNSQTHLSRSSSNHTVQHKKLKNEINQILEQKIFKKTLEKHDFINVLTKGTLEEKRIAYQALSRVLKELLEEMGKSSSEGPPIFGIRKEENIHNKTNHMETETYRMVYRDRKKKEEQIQLLEKQTNQETELNRLKNLIEHQRDELRQEQEKYVEIVHMLEKQQKEIMKFQEEKEYQEERDEETKKMVSKEVVKKIKSDILLERMRYGY